MKKIIYRAVSVAEWADIQERNNTFRSIENTYEGKLFVENISDAIFFQQKLTSWDNISYVIIEIVINFEDYTQFELLEADARTVLAIDRENLSLFNKSIISIKQI